MKGYRCINKSHIFRLIRNKFEKILRFTWKNAIKLTDTIMKTAKPKARAMRTIFGGLSGFSAAILMTAPHPKKFSKRLPMNSARIARHIVQFFAVNSLIPNFSWNLPIFQAETVSWNKNEKNHIIHTYYH